MPSIQISILNYFVSDRKWQYLLFAAEPYETIAFKVPSREVDKTETKVIILFFMHNMTKKIMLFGVEIETNQCKRARVKSVKQHRRDSTDGRAVNWRVKSDAKRGFNSFLSSGSV